MDAHPRKLVEALVKLLVQREHVNDSHVNDVARHLRRATASSDDHSMAIKYRIKQAILRHNDAAEGINKVTSFEKEYERLMKMNSSLLHASIAMLEPLAYPKPPIGSAKLHQDILQPPVVKQENVDEKHVVDVLLTSSLPLPLSTNNNAINSEINSLIWCSKELESLLIRDLIYIFQGIDGKYIKFDSRSELYVVDPALGLKQAVKDTVLCLCELGFLFKIVSSYIHKANGGNNVISKDAVNKGQVVQAFAFSLNEELHDYYRLLAVLDVELNDLTNNDNGDDGGSRGITLLRLRAWIQEPLDRMLLMARLVDAVGPLTGGALTSRLHGHTKHGDIVISNLSTRLLTSVCAPIYAMMVRWILYGELYDPYDEFFVGAKTGVVLSMWQDTYFLRTQTLPSFVSKSLAMKVLIIGKSINFIRACIPKLPTVKAISTKKKGMDRPSVADALGFGKSAVVSYDEVVANERIQAIPTSKLEDENGVSISGATKDMIDVLQATSYGDEEKLSEIVNNIASYTDTKLLHMMNTSFNLNVHLLALKKFMLLGQGDFVTCLMDSVGPELKKRANQLYRHNLTGMLEVALRSSNAQFESTSVLDRIGVRLLDAQSGDTGWEVFALDYAVDSPLNAVVHTDAISKYRLAFSMLWKLKRVEWTLSGAWKQLMTLTHSKGIDSNKFPKLKPIIHKCTLHRGQMVHVVNNLCNFLMFEVMESAWSTLQEKLGKALSLDDVIKAHDNYLAEILDRALLGPQHEGLCVQLHQLLQSILRFCSLEETLVADVLTAVSQAQSATRPDDSTSYNGVPAYLVARLDENIKDYHLQFDLLMTMLRDGLATEKVGTAARDIVRFLSFRLDFNEFHANKNKHLPQFPGV